MQKQFYGKMIRNLHLKWFVLMCFFNYGESVPIDYCFPPLDKSDCGLKPTPVFTYYKPGSRCEMQFWRGCPTFNKFPDEVLCSHHCIGKLLDRVADNDLPMNFLDPPIKDEEVNPCNLPIKEGDCGVDSVQKYTYANDSCTVVTWKGCESPNLFDNEETCIETCSKRKLVEQLIDLPDHDIEAIDQILDNAMTYTTEAEKLMLNFKMKVKQVTDKVPDTTEADRTEPVVDDVTETPIQTDSPTELAIDTSDSPVPIEPTVPEEPTAEPTIEAVTTEADVTTVDDVTTENIVQPTTEDSGSVDEVIVT